MELLNKIQQTLKVPKSQFNKFGNFYYRNAEDILEAVKPLLGDGTLVCTDSIVQLGDRFYVETTAVLSTTLGSVSAKGYAREPLTRKGMDDSQITGAAASYARKRALGNLFSLDDEKDADFNAGTNTNSTSIEDIKPAAIGFFAAETKKKQVKKQPIEPVKDVVQLIYDKYMESCPAGKIVDMSVLCKAIWERYGMYPTNESSVDKVLSEIPITDVIVDNNFIEGIE